MTIFIELSKPSVAFTEPAKTTTVFTEPAKSDVVYSDPIQQGVTPKDLAGLTPKDIAGLTPYELKKSYGKRIKSPTFTEPAKTTTIFTEPSKE